MDADRRRRRCICNAQLHILSSPLLFLSLILPASSFAQITSKNPSLTASGVPVPIAPIALYSTPIPNTFSTATLTSTTTASTALPQSAQPSSIPSPVTSDNAPPLYPASTSSGTSDHTTDQESHLLNYYFVFLALIGVFACIGIYMMHKRRRRRKAQLRNSGQNALARDLDGWVNTRRWVYGSWRGGAAGGLARREEGLNEHGEAPPPYKPRMDATTNDVGLAGEPAVLSPDGSRDATTGLAIPLRTLSRGSHATLEPPGYQETIHSVSVDEGTRPNTTETRPGTSTRDLLRTLDRPPNSSA